MDVDAYLGEYKKEPFPTKLGGNFHYSNMSFVYSFFGTEFPTVVHA